jgi:hypothetical protein
MVKICQTGLLKLKFKIIFKKRIFRFLPKFRKPWMKLKFFLPISKSLSPLGCQGWVVCYTSKCEKIPYHCTLMDMQGVPHFTTSNVNV